MPVEARPVAAAGARRIRRALLTPSLTLFGQFACTAGSASEPQPERATTETVAAPVAVPIEEQPLAEAGDGGIGSGYGGHSSGFGGRGKRQPQVLHAKAQVTGSLDRYIIRRVVRDHVNEVRSCYDTGLSKDPNLQGRLVIEFVIGADGKVSSAKVNQALAKDAAVGTCIAEAITHWTFPKPPGGDDVTVVNPYNLLPG